MGAACSATVLTKYRHLRAYLLSKPCLTFDMVETFVPKYDRPPVVLLGETHNWSESDDIEGRCVTTLTAFKKIVSDCANPTCKIFFIVEGDVYPEPQQEKRFSEYYHKYKFNLGDVWNKTMDFAQDYTDGLKVVPFDMFYASRNLFWSQNYLVSKNKLSRRHMLDEMKVAITLAFEHMSVTSKDLPALFAVIDSEMENESEKHRYSVTRYVNEKNAPNLARRKRLINILHDKIMQNIGNRSVEKELWKEEDEILRETPVYSFGMFQLAYWCYCLLMHIIKTHSDYGNPLQTDISVGEKKVEQEFKKLLEKPAMDGIAMFITLCGDYITYFAYLRDKLSAKNTNSIYVLYGGSRHTFNFSGLISANNTHKQDIVRVADAQCDDAADFYQKWCDDRQNNSRTQTMFREAW